jgi:hypothetical protein
MPRLIQTLADYDKATLCLVQRAYNDFCRDAAIQDRRPGRRVSKLSGVSNGPPDQQSRRAWPRIDADLRNACYRPALAR